MRGIRRVVAGAAVGAALAGSLSGCGIRATAVPVDAGAAPSRAACVLPAATPTGSGAQRPEVLVYLVCGQRLFPVRRTVRTSPTSGLPLERVLLAELEREPDAAEERGGFASEVPGGLTVSSGGPGDPARTWRLNEPPDSLPGYAVGQVVCTFADASSGGTGRPVLLGGPDQKIAPRSYTCDDALRTNPDAGPTAGSQVG